jgi:DNA topoisomerase I
MVVHLTDEISIPQKRFIKILGDPEATAKAVNLIYVSDSQQGFVRVRSGSGFKYLDNNKPLKNKNALERIRKLVIPPAWENVWICTLENGHLQVTGIDAMHRKQYRYHPLWNQLRNQTKFYRMLAFGKSLPAIRTQVEKDLALPGLPKNKVLAAVIALMERTSIRIGSDMYEKLYGSFGLTTLKDKHVDINGSKVKFCFKGKKGIEHEVRIRSSRLARIVRQCRDIPGKELFQYYDENGARHTIDSGMVNDYLRNIVEGDFTAKDFRTWAGTVRALVAFKEAGPAGTKAETKKKVLEVLDKVSQHLGNTRTVCRKYYVHPSILEMYETSTLDSYLDKLTLESEGERRVDLAVEEKVLMKILSTI